MQWQMPVAFGGRSARAIQYMLRPMRREGHGGRTGGFVQLLRARIYTRQPGVLVLKPHQAARFGGGEGAGP